jgi:hypothetical protein
VIAIAADEAVQDIVAVGGNDGASRGLSNGNPLAKVGPSSLFLQYERLIDTVS